MKILLTGAAGMLGRAAAAVLGEAHDVDGVDLPDGDLTDPFQATDLVAKHAPDWIVHAAAFTDVDGAESRRDEAWAANADAAGHLARACADAGAGLSYVSTDYVFPGAAAAGYAEDDPRDPVNHYGATKAAGEDRVLAALGDRAQIVRTSWLFGAGPRNFVLTIRRLLAERPTLRVVDDQRGCPTYAPDLARTLLFLVECGVERGAGGVYHATNAGVCTWFEFAREIARLGGDDPDRIEPCATAEYPTPARRPACSVLRSERLERLGCPPRPPWRDALARYLADLD